MLKTLAMGLNYWALVAFLVFIGAVYGVHRHYVGVAVQQNTVKIEQKYKTQFDKAEKKAKVKEEELKTSADKLKKEKDDKIKSISMELASANQRLLQRTKRPSGKDLSPSIGQTCTGRGLYQEDGLFLRGEASRAEALIAERDYYYKAYENARKKLDGK